MAQKSFILPFFHEFSSQKYFPKNHFIMGNSMQGNRLHVFSKCENASLTLIQEKIGFLKRKWSFFAFLSWIRVRQAFSRFRNTHIDTPYQITPKRVIFRKRFWAQNSWKMANWNFVASKEVLIKIFDLNKFQTFPPKQKIIFSIKQKLS